MANSNPTQLKKAGVPIKSVREPVKTRYGIAHISRYSLAVSADGK